MSLEKVITDTGNEIRQDLQKVPAMFRAPLENNINRIMVLLLIMAEKIERLENGE